MSGFCMANARGNALHWNWPFPGCGRGRACGLCPKSGAQRVRASPSEVYPAAKLHWHFVCGFDFRHSLWLQFETAFTVLKGLFIGLSWPGDNFFQTVGGGRGAYELCPKSRARRTRLAFRGLSWWASVILYLWFRF